LREWEDRPRIGFRVIGIMRIVDVRMFHFRIPNRNIVPGRIS
jgi:hypothetical protein